MTLLPRSRPVFAKSMLKNDLEMKNYYYLVVGNLHVYSTAKTKRTELNVKDAILIKGSSNTFVMLKLN